VSEDRQVGCFCCAAILMMFFWVFIILVGLIVGTSTITI